MLHNAGPSAVASKPAVYFSCVPSKPPGCFTAPTGYAPADASLMCTLCRQCSSQAAGQPLLSRSEVGEKAPCRSNTTCRQQLPALFPKALPSGSMAASTVMLCPATYRKADLEMLEAPPRAASFRCGSSNAEMEPSALQTGEGRLPGFLRPHADAAACQDGSNISSALPCRPEAGRSQAAGGAP